MCAMKCGAGAATGGGNTWNQIPERAWISNNPVQRPGRADAQPGRAPSGPGMPQWVWIVGAVLLAVLIAKG